MQECVEKLPQELLNIIVEYHHCKDCYNKDTHCLKCFLNCDCETCKNNVKLNKELCLECLCNQINQCKCCSKCIYLPILYYHRLKPAKCKKCDKNIIF